MKIKKAWIAIVGVLTMALTAFLGARRDKKIKMKKIGITGSLASGKTTASKILSKKIGPLFSADNVVKKVKELKKVINNSKKVEKGITSEIKTLEKDKKTNKKQITNLKRKLTNTKKNTVKMQKAFDNDDAEKAAEYLKKFVK